MQRVADADLALDLRVRQGGHDGPALHVGSASSHVPGRHPDPELETGDTGARRLRVAYGWARTLGQDSERGIRTSSQTTTVGPSHCAKGKPCLRASSSNSCLQVTDVQTFKSHTTHKQSVLFINPQSVMPHISSLSFNLLNHPPKGSLEHITLNA